MIPNQWYAVLKSREVPHGKPVGAIRLGEKMVLWRDSRGQAVCQSDKCAHRGAALSAGKVVGGCVACPFHGLQYDATGRCQLIPANGRITPVPERFHVHTYPTREAHGFIWLWWGEGRENLPPLPWFDDLDDEFPYASFEDHWTVHYSRAIENQLDVAHLPFVHYNTIGRGGRTLIDGPVTRLENDRLRVWVYNRVDDGTAPRKPQDIPEPGGTALLHFHFPNLWQNRLGENMRVFLAFVPIDEENTKLYLRFYGRFVRVPLLDRLFCGLGNLGNRIILGQDKRVVLTQQPKKTALEMGEKLFQADRPIVAYRQRRKELIEQARAGRTADDHSGAAVSA
jgi:phenylpropionate dioxygenase-like ring-hydroxylating dioxygenase large terminal subunit